MTARSEHCLMSKVLRRGLLQKGSVRTPAAATVAATATMLGSETLLGRTGAGYPTTELRDGVP